MTSKTLYWLAVGALIALAWTAPAPSKVDAVKCALDGSACERLKECSLNCERCKDTDKCCCKHRDSCECVDPTTGESCCESTK